MFTNLEKQSCARCGLRDRLCIKCVLYRLFNFVNQINGSLYHHSSSYSKLSRDKASILFYNGGEGAYFGI